MTERYPEPTREVGASGSLRRLDNIVRALPETELASLIKRLGIRVDVQKRIDVPGQVARALVGMPDVREPSRLPNASQELLHRVAEASGLLEVRALPAGFEALMARGILFARRGASAEGSYELVLPHAYLVQLPSWPTEDPRSLRALVAQAPFETVSAIASHYLGRPATPPIALALEAAWEVLTDHERLVDEIERLPLLERRLLEAIESMGGEVETTELLDLEREPMRLRSAKGVSTTRRGAGFALERRALLIPVHPNRHLIPTEVAAIVGAERKLELESRREVIKREVLGADHMPRRAQFARDPAALALALTVGALTPLANSQGEIKPNVGTPRSMIVRLSQRFGRAAPAVSLIAALSRATGLWEATAASTSSPPGSFTVAELSAQLFSVWLNGGAWDEARPEPELLRAAPDQRDASPSRALRDIVLDALVSLGVDGWVPYAAFERYVLEDPRIVGIERLLRRWAERLAITEPVPPEEIVRRVVLESLPVLGVVDLGSESEMALLAVNPELSASSNEEAAKRAVGRSTTLRLTQRGRVYLAGRTSSTTAEPSSFVDGQVLRVGGAALVAQVLSLAALSDIGRVEDTVDLVLSPAAITRAISAGALADEIRDRIEVLATLPDSLAQVLTQASVVVGKASFVPASAFMWIEDPEIRELLRTRRATADLFVDPSPTSGLLVGAGVDLDRLVRKCRGLGVEIEVSNEGTMRAMTGGGARGSSGRWAATGRGFTPMPSPAVVSPTSEGPSRSGTRAAPTRSRTPLPRSK